MELLEHARVKRLEVSGVVLVMCGLVNAAIARAVFAGAGWSDVMVSVTVGIVCGLVAVMLLASLVLVADSMPFRLLTISLRCAFLLSLLRVLFRFWQPHRHSIDELRRGVSMSYVKINARRRVALFLSAVYLAPAPLIVAEGLTLSSLPYLLNALMLVAGNLLLWTPSLVEWNYYRQARAESRRLWAKGI